MRALVLLTTMLLVASVSGAWADTKPFHAGISRISVTGDPGFDVLVWYPTQAEEAPWQMADYPIPATRNTPIAPGPFPIVLLAHGGGLGGGKPYVLSELSADLARHGFVVVAPFHGTAPLSRRASQIHLALDTVLADPRFASHVDAQRLGMLGFSLGGAVTLELAGAAPDFAHLDAYCDAHPADVMSCEHAPGGGGRKSSAVPWWAFWVAGPPSVAPLPLKAIVLLDPFAVLFPRASLAAVTMPVLLFRPDHSQQGEENALGLAAALPHPPQYQTIPGSHFIFVDVCPPSLKATSPEVCQEAPGVDRASIHTAIEAQIAGFFSAHL